MIRLTYKEARSLHKEDILIVKSRTGERRILPHKWFINRNTPVGEPADIYEIKPYNGYKYIPWKDLIAVEREE